MTKQYRVEGVNIYSGEVDWSTPVEAPDESSAAIAGRTVCLGEIGSEKCAVLDMVVFNAPN